MLGSIIDTPAGGSYEPACAPAQTNREHEQGIGRLWTGPEPGPELATYLDLVRSLNPDGKLGQLIRPGSPRLARALLRPGDRLILTERHPADLPMLAAELAGDRQVTVWYPIGDRGPSERFHRALRGLGIPGILCAELGLFPYTDPNRLCGSGMVIVNPHW